MALTDAQTLDIHQLLGVPYGDFAGNPNWRASHDLTARLSGLSAAQEEKVSEILSEFATVRYATGRLSGEYSDDPARRRGLLKRAMASLLAYDPGDYDLGGSMELARA